MAVIPLVEMTTDERRALEEAQRAVHSVHEWRRYQAVRLLADGREAGEVAQVLGCSVSSVYYGADDWRERKVAGLAEEPHEGRPRRLDAMAEAALEQLLTAGSRSGRGGIERLSGEDRVEGGQERLALLA
jgi:transposase